MAFSHLAGITTPGAPDEIVDWFATFQQWITANVGWTVEAGGGTTDLILRSIGEAGGLTMLYMRVRRDPGNPNRVLVEVQDDLAGTHVTAEGGYLDGAGAQFAFWMSGDMDAVSFCFRGGALYHSIYAGMVMPFAQTVPDETYRTIATSTQIAGSILRDSGGVWDVDQALYGNDRIFNCVADRYDASWPLSGTFLGQGNLIAGQLKHISWHMDNPGPVVMDVLETGRPGATTAWIVLQDRNNRRYAMRTGGILPTGITDSGAWASATGVAATIAWLVDAIRGFMVARGWTDLGDPALPGSAAGRLFFSACASGEEQLYAGFYGTNFAFHAYTQDADPPAHRHPAAIPATLLLADFPVNYWLSGDNECVILVVQRGAGYWMTWSGLLPTFAPGLLTPYAGPPLTPYKAYTGYYGEGVGAAMRGEALRGHEGTWGLACGFFVEAITATNSNPSAFDGVTYLVWPLLVTNTVLLWPDAEIYGQLKYCGFSDGGGIASLDTITIGPQVYTVFHTDLGANFCVRTT